MLIVKINEQQKEWVIKAAAGLAMFMLCYIIIIHPVFQNITTLRQSIADSQTRRELYQEVQSLKENIDRKESFLATVQDRSQLLGQISDIAGRAQLRVVTLTPRTELVGGYTKLRMEMDGQGAFLSLLKFLQVVERIGTVIKVRDISVLWQPSSGAQQSEYSLQIQLVLETFLKQRAPKNNG